jgi:hypothetical protein
MIMPLLNETEKLFHQFREYTFEECKLRYKTTLKFHKKSIVDKIIIIIKTPDHYKAIRNVKYPKVVKHLNLIYQIHMV